MILFTNPWQETKLWGLLLGRGSEAKKAAEDRVKKMYDKEKAVAYYLTDEWF